MLKIISYLLVSSLSFWVGRSFFNGDHPVTYEEPVEEFESSTPKRLKKASISKPIENESISLEKTNKRINSLSASDQQRVKVISRAFASSNPLSRPKDSLEAFNKKANAPFDSRFLSQGSKEPLRAGMVTIRESSPEKIIKRAHELGLDLNNPEELKSAIETKSPTVKANKGESFVDFKLLAVSCPALFDSAKPLAIRVNERGQVIDLTPVESGHEIDSAIFHCAFPAFPPENPERFITIYSPMS